MKPIFDSTDSTVPMDKGPAATDALPIGLTCAGSMTVTETHIVLGAGLIGGFAPVHVDHEAARSRGLQGPILHGSLTAAIMSAAIGRSLPDGRWTFLGQSNEYRAPVYAGDTLTTTWRLAAQQPHAGLGGTVARFEGACINQRGERIATADARLLRRGDQRPTDGSMVEARVVDS